MKEQRSMAEAERLVSLKVDRLASHISSQLPLILRLASRSSPPEDSQRARRILSQLSSSLALIHKEANAFPAHQPALQAMARQLVGLEAHIKKEDEAMKAGSVLWDEEEEQGTREREEGDNPYEAEATLQHSHLANAVMEMRGRAEESQRLERDIQDLHQIHLDLNRIVHEQGEMVDSIEENVERAESQVRRGNSELKKAVSKKGARVVGTTAVVGGLALGGPVGLAAGSAVAGVLAAAAGVVTGIYGGRWLKRSMESEGSAQKND